MTNILIFSGTTEGRQLSEWLTGAKIRHGVSVATEYGELVMEPSAYANIHRGRLTQEQMEELMLTCGYSLIVDATHPYATEVTRTIVAAAEKLKAEGVELTYLRLARKIDIGSADESEMGRPIRCQDVGEAVTVLKRIAGNILLTTGSKELGSFAAEEDLRQRIYARVLPGVESISLCLEQGLKPKQIIAMQGPFSREMNLALIRELDISCMVTKCGGKNGGFEEKCKAAQAADIPILVIEKREMGEDSSIIPHSYAEICEILARQLPGLAMNLQSQENPADRMKGTETGTLEIVLAGIGMGDQSGLTEEVRLAIGRADLVIGASRVIQPYREGKIYRESYDPKDIAAWLQQMQKSDSGKQRAVILFSGDSGFYSGCAKTYAAIQAAITEGTLQANVRILPGISTIQVMAARCGISWQDAGIYSIHGRNHEGDWKAQLLGQIERHTKLFVLVSGAEDVRVLGELLQDTDAYDIYVGYQLTYRDEWVRKLTPEQCLEITEPGLYAVMICQNMTGARGQRKHFRATGMSGFCQLPGYSDEAFLRDQVPMTKEEIRHLCICKLHLNSDSIFYDIGSGTGSIAVEVSKLSEQIRTYAIEQKERAVRLMENNRKRFGCSNMQIIEGKAPECLDGLEPPTHAFVGGSGGNLMDILRKLQSRNPSVRVVVTGVSLETIAELTQIPERLPVKDYELVQVQVSRYTPLGRYRMPKAENPIFICSFAFSC